MNLPKIKTKSESHNIIILYIILFFSCTSLIIINYTTIRILSASRAYINGESHYSKGQNKASRHLITYLYTENNKSWQAFKKELTVPLGDRLARTALDQGLDDSISKKGFRLGRNKERDLDDLIWVFKNFKTVPFLKKAIYEWEKADVFVNQLLKMGIEVHKKIEAKELDAESKRKLSAEINIICEKLGASADKFSNTVGDGTREIKDNLIVINIFFILIIISSTSIYYIVALKRLILSEQTLKNKRIELREIILDLEKTKNELSIEIVQHKKLIGTISHDIKSPLKYIAMTNKYIYEESNKYDNEKLKKNTKSVYSSTLQLFNFIDSLLTYSKIFLGGKPTEKAVYNLHDLVQQKCDLFNEIAEASSNILINDIDINTTTNINKEILSVIIHNIIDNAIKNTEKGTIRVHSKINNKKLYLTIEDTGKGFKQEDLLYYNQLSHQQSSEKLMLKNSGMGLLMIIELIHILNGNLKFYSEGGKGSKIEIITDIN